MPFGFGRLLNELLKMSDCLGREKCVRTHVTYFCWNILEYKHVPSASDGVNNGPMLIVPGTSLNTTLHCVPPLLNGVIHFDNLGSYTVIIIVISSDVVQTTCTYVPDSAGRFRSHIRMPRGHRGTVLTRHINA